MPAPSNKALPSNSGRRDGGNPSTPQGSPRPAPTVAINQPFPTPAPVSGSMQGTSIAMPSNANTSLPLGGMPRVIGGTDQVMYTQPAGQAPSGALIPVTPPEGLGAGQGGPAPAVPALNPIGTNPPTLDPATYQSTQTRTPSRQGS